MHQIEALIDTFKWHGMSDEGSQIDFARSVSAPVLEGTPSGSALRRRGFSDPPLALGDGSPTKLRQLLLQRVGRRAV